ncbi:winged helix-turn-helix transcriptional regulator [Streptomyces nodosus]|uniref:Transcriptional regulator n=1 Tax=Streptomyces nodosus TaxID=40318 RepID=A0A0B5D6L0_9ACTN|nr:helix-turn-helix domain-containing protein [Streptomyces nodosus]AJE38883.1 hypothetical protein SNOD_01470 [Streptomyces nodosus]MBB4789676.1 DNA-binding HxlR family transcriptional regulator [Streptomyces nodosus]QEV37468.1 transcriptional regulator [Streptomyces nodosus]
MALGTGYRMDDCAIARTLDVVGERWTLLIISYLFFGLRRYSDIRKRLGISPAVLTQRLNGLVEEGIVARVPGAGAHDEYELTPRGETLWPVVSGLAQFGNKNYLEPKFRQDFTHHQCGTSLDDTGYCERCQVVPAARDVDRQPRPVDLEPAYTPTRGTEPHRLLGPLPR